MNKTIWIKDREILKPGKKKDFQIGGKWYFVRTFNAAWSALLVERH